MDRNIAQKPLKCDIYKCCEMQWKSMFPKKPISYEVYNLV